VSAPHPVLKLRKVCTAAGVHTLSHLAVLAHVESRNSCRMVAESLNIPYATVWRATLALQQQELITVVDEPHRSRTKRRMLLSLSATGRQLLNDLDGMISK
jgi:DNA-binding MarR family transcriptional regulator